MMNRRRGFDTVIDDFVQRQMRIIGIITFLIATVFNGYSSVTGCTEPSKALTVNGTKVVLCSDDRSCPAVGYTCVHLWLGIDVCCSEIVVDDQTPSQAFSKFKSIPLIDILNSHKSYAAIIEDYKRKLTSLKRTLPKTNHQLLTHKTAPETTPKTTAAPKIPQSLLQFIKFKLVDSKQLFTKAPGRYAPIKDKKTIRSSSETNLPTDSSHLYFLPVDPYAQPSPPLSNRNGRTTPPSGNSFLPLPIPPTDDPYTGQSFITDPAVISVSTPFTRRPFRRFSLGTSRRPQPTDDDGPAFFVSGPTITPSPFTGFRETSPQPPITRSGPIRTSRPFRQRTKSTTPFVEETTSTTEPPRIITTTRSTTSIPRSTTTTVRSTIPRRSTTILTTPRTTEPARQATKITKNTIPQKFITIAPDLYFITIIPEGLRSTPTIGTTIRTTTWPPDEITFPVTTTTWPPDEVTLPRDKTTTTWPPDEVTFPRTSTTTTPHLYQTTTDNPLNGREPLKKF